MLVDPDGRTVDHDQLAVEGLAHRFEKPVPHTGFAPAHETVAGLARVSLLAPRSSSIRDVRLGVLTPPGGIKPETDASRILIGDRRRPC